MEECSCRLSSQCRLQPSGSPAQPIALCLISLLPLAAVGLWRLPESLLMGPRLRKV